MTGLSPQILYFIALCKPCLDGVSDAGKVCAVLYAQAAAAGVALVEALQSRTWKNGSMFYLIYDFLHQFIKLISWWDQISFIGLRIKTAAVSIRQIGNCMGGNFFCPKVGRGREKGMLPTTRNAKPIFSCSACFTPGKCCTFFVS